MGGGSMLGGGSELGGGQHAGWGGVNWVIAACWGPFPAYCSSFMAMAILPEGKSSIYSLKHPLLWACSWESLLPPVGSLFIDATR